MRRTRAENKSSQRSVGRSKCTALAVAFTFLVRLTAVFLPPLLLALAVVELLRHRVRSPAARTSG